jgi:molybdopterin/thiamine biosynthesis adenylyltransferase/rhodanese-related sulfurtransferase
MQTESLPDLTQSEKIQYSRHLMLPEVGLEGQRRLKASRLLIIGAGGLGSPAAMYLAAAGVGTIGIVDFDNIDLSNLQRQILHSSDDIGSSKCQSAKHRMAQINPNIDIVVHEEKVSADSIEKLVGQYDVVIDGTDNFATRYLINDACVLLNKPNVYGAIYRFEGQASVFVPKAGPCYRCLFPDPPPPDAVPNCAEGGVLGVLAGIIGVIQATEAIKLVLNLGTSLVGRLLIYDALEMRFDKVNIKRNANCHLCGDNPTITSVVETNFACAPTTVALGTYTVSEGISAVDLNCRLGKGEKIFLLDVRNPEEHLLCHLPGSSLIPLPDLPKRLSELDSGEEIIVYCKSGARSRSAMQLLREAGFSRVKGLTGGILAWIAEVDTSMPKY